MISFIDAMTDRMRSAHTLLLEASILIVEHFSVLERLPDRLFVFFAVPLAIQHGTSLPVRASAI